MRPNTCHFFRLRRTASPSFLSLTIHLFQADKLRAWSGSRFHRSTMSISRVSCKPNLPDGWSTWRRYQCCRLLGRRPSKRRTRTVSRAISSRQVSEWTLWPWKMLAFMALDTSHLWRRTVSRLRRGWCCHGSRAEQASKKRQMASLPFSTITLIYAISAVLRLLYYVFLLSLGLFAFLFLGREY